jgi:hypothetical protein
VNERLTRTASQRVFTIVRGCRTAVSLRPRSIRVPTADGGGGSSGLLSRGRVAQHWPVPAGAIEAYRVRLGRGLQSQHGRTVRDAVP